MKYLALADGTVGKGREVRRVREGETFTLPAGSPVGKWMKPVADDAPSKALKKVVKPDGPSTFSEVAKVDAKALAPKGGESLI